MSHPAPAQTEADPAWAPPARQVRITDGLFAHLPGLADAPLLASIGPDGWHDLTVGEVAGRVRALAAGLVKSGVAPGDRVAILSRTRVEWTLCDYAVGTAGAVVVPIYETSSAEQVEWILGDSGAVAAFCESPKHAAVIASVRDRLPALAHVWCFAEGDLSRLEEAGSDVDPAEVEARRTAVGSDDLATIVYTSGTTGRPKGCELTHGNAVAELEAIVPKVPQLFSPGQSTLLFLPLAHIFGRCIEIAAISTRTRLGYCPDTRDLVEHLQSFRPTFMLAVPRVFEKIYNSAKTAAHAPGTGTAGRFGSALRGRIFDDAVAAAVAWSVAADGPGGVGAVPLHREARRAFFDQLVYRKLREAMGGRVAYAVSAGGPLGARLGHFFAGIGVRVLEAYGLTETLGAVTFNWPETPRIGTVGQPIPGVELRIADDGEIVVRGPNVFVGYWRNKEATSEVVDADGWFHTGDIGQLDADSYLTITGRKKEILITAAGKNVVPALLEDTIRAHRLVSQAMVVGEGRPFIAALITIDPEAWPDWAAEHGKLGPLRDHLDDAELHAELQQAVDEANQHVSRAESIRKFVVLADDFTEESGELTPTLKVKRAVVNARRAADVDGIYH